ncbi:MAG: ATP-binding cassette domain-containing protein [Actinomycetota bacterium]|nr:ATP-binding cassette domain-containing protein [Actinomycetota bacterium]
MNRSMQAPDPGVSPLIEAQGITKSYRRGPEEIHALQGVELALRRGELIALVGPSGSGKTTLLNVLAGWEQPDSGALLWEERVITSARELRWNEMAIVPQGLGLMEELTLAENVELPVRLGTAPGASGRVGELLGRLGLDALAGRLPAETSLGEQQRAAVARALVASPKLLMADEPTAHQDALWSRRVLETLTEATAAGTACLVASHHRETVEYCNRVAGIRDGRVRDVEELSSLVLKEEH